MSQKQSRSGLYADHGGRLASHTRSWMRKLPQEPSYRPLSYHQGAGNTAFPLLQHNENPELVIWATDYSSTAVDVVKANSLYPKPPNGKGILHAAVWDITSKPSANSSTTYSLPEGLEPGTVDVITVIYVLSALHPTEWDQAIHNLYTVCLTPQPTDIIC